MLSQGCGVSLEGGAFCKCLAMGCGVSLEGGAYQTVERIKRNAVVVKKSLLSSENSNCCKMNKISK